MEQKSLENKRAWPVTGWTLERKVIEAKVPIAFCFAATAKGLEGGVVVVGGSSPPPPLADRVKQSANLEMYKRTCAGRVTVPATTVPAPTTTATDKLQFTLQQSRKALRGAVEQFTVNVMEVKRLSTLKKALNVAKPAMRTFQQLHQAYKFKVTVGIIFHKAVDPTVVTQPPVVLTSKMVAVYADAVAPIDDVNPPLLS